jgi:transcriptional regulator with XRE-family HTH domain
MAIDKVTTTAVREVVADLRRLRIERDLTYEEMAVAVQMSRRTLIRLMTEDGRPNARTLYKLRTYVQDSERVSA